MEQRYYYKTQNGLSTLSVKEKLINDSYIEITEQEFLELQQRHEPTDEQKSKWEELAETKQEIAELEKWFADYDIQVAQYSRCQRLGIDYDKDIAELDSTAQQVAQLLKTLRAKLGE